MMSRSNKVISILSAILVVFLGGSAFWLSFDALQHMVIEIGVDPKIAWLYPAIIDGAIITFSLSVLRSNLNHEKSLYAWFLVGIFTLISVVLNILHAKQELLAQFLGAIPPIALFLSFELLMSQIKSISVRINKLKSLEDLSLSFEEVSIKLDETVRKKTVEIDDLAIQIQQLTGQKQCATNPAKT